MSVKIRKVVNNRKGSKTQGKVYGRAVVSDTINTKKLCQNIRDRCTLTEPDVVAVVSALITEVSGQLALGNRVVLDGFGSFKVGLSSTPADSAKKFTSANIKCLRVIFQPAIEMINGKRVKTLLKELRVDELAEYKGLNDEDTGKLSGGGTAGGGTAGGGTAGGSTAGGGSGTSGGTTGDTSGGTGSEGGGKDTGSEGDSGHVNL